MISIPEFEEVALSQRAIGEYSLYASPQEDGAKSRTVTIARWYQHPYWADRSILYFRKSTVAKATVSTDDSAQVSKLYQLVEALNTGLSADNLPRTIKTRSSWQQVNDLLSTH